MFWPARLHWLRSVHRYTGPVWLLVTQRPITCPHSWRQTHRTRPLDKRKAFAPVGLLGPATRLQHTLPALAATPMTPTRTRSRCAPFLSRQSFQSATRQQLPQLGMQLFATTTLT